MIAREIQALEAALATAKARLEAAQRTAAELRRAGDHRALKLFLPSIPNRRADVENLERQLRALTSEVHR